MCSEDRTPTAYVTTSPALVRCEDMEIRTFRHRRSDTEIDQDIQRDIDQYLETLLVRGLSILSQIDTPQDQRIQKEGLMG